MIAQNFLSITLSSPTSLTKAPRSTRYFTAAVQPFCTALINFVFWSKNHKILYMVDEEKEEESEIPLMQKLKMFLSKGII